MNEYNNPLEYTYDRELEHVFLCFCSFICILQNKKMNLANIFLHVLRDSKIRNLYKHMIEVDSDYDAIAAFLKYDASLHKSKYVKRYLSTRKETLKRDDRL